MIVAGSIPFVIRGVHSERCSRTRRGSCLIRLLRRPASGEPSESTWADATIERDTVVVRSERVKAPVAVRYAWSHNPAGCNLYNREGLPAAPFRTDDWPGVTFDKR